MKKIFISLILLLFASQVMAYEATRIMHPSYRAIHKAWGKRNPWNRDYTRILMYESRITVNGVYGRGWVAGKISDLKNATTREQYESATVQLDPEGYRCPTCAYWREVYWSPFEGEENIIYGRFCNDTAYDADIRKMNVDTGVITTVVSYKPGDGTNIENAMFIGFTTVSNTAMLSFNGEYFYYGGYEIDVDSTSPTYQQKTRYTAIGLTPPGLGQTVDPRLRVCEPKWREMPAFGHGHDQWSYDGNGLFGDYVAQNYGSGSSQGIREICVGTGLFWNDPYTSPPMAHTSWLASPDWYIGDDVATYANDILPSVMTYGIYKQTFNRTTHAFSRETLLQKQSAGQWLTWTGRSCTSSPYVCNSDETCQLHNGALECVILHNWNALPIPTIRKDGKQIMFISTDGLYSIEDYSLYQRTPWGLEGVFLLDLHDSYSHTSSGGFVLGGTFPYQTFISPDTGVLLKGGFTDFIPIFWR